MPLAQSVIDGSNKLPTNFLYTGVPGGVAPIDKDGNVFVNATEDNTMYWYQFVDKWLPTVKKSGMYYSVSSSMNTEESALQLRLNCHSGKYGYIMLDGADEYEPYVKFGGDISAFYWPFTTNSDTEMLWREGSSSEDMAKFTRIGAEDYSLSLVKDGAWSQVEGSLVGPTAKNGDTVYQAEGDGFISFAATGYQQVSSSYTDAANPPTTAGATSDSHYGGKWALQPVHRGDYYKVAGGSPTIRWWYFA